MLESKRCKLVNIQQSDYEDVKELYLDHEVRRYLGGTVEENQYSMNFQRMVKSENDEWYWVIRKKESMEFVGLISLDIYHDGISTEISYQLLPKWWGNGYGKEMVKRVLEYAFDDLKLTRVVAETQSANIPSCKLLESVGMKLEDRMLRFGAEQNIFSIRG